ncbi:MAG: Gfo/Idh/MocA family protein [Jatrophihabitans sp.]
MTEPIRWAVLGTANIAARAFLPAMREAGGQAVVVGSRDPDRARSWAAANEVQRAADYAGALTDPAVQAVYIALPNHEHATWAAAALAAGHAVLCEKPLGLDASEVSALLSGLAPDALLWESFVFPFHPQTALLHAHLDALGGLREIVSEFHFNVTNTANIRWSATLGGGALMDVGCYPIRLARLLFDAEPEASSARAFGAHGVDADIAAVVDFPEQRRLVLSAGMRRAGSTLTRLIGPDGELRVSNPFHPRSGDTVERWSDGELVESWPAAEGTAFRHAAAHVHEVLRGEVAPRYLAARDSLGNARAIDLIRSSWEMT